VDFVDFFLQRGFVLVEHLCALCATQARACNHRMCSDRLAVNPFLSSSQTHVSTHTHNKER
jgi:hypothetical protein